MGSRFRCHCGAVCVVEAPKGHNARVVRCASCGGAREKGELDCAFCGAGFTLLDRDLHTVCPGCLARVSDKAKFCHHCGEGLGGADSLIRHTALNCPVCENEKLQHRCIGAQSLSITECGRCAGMYLGQDVFRTLAQTAIEKGQAPSGHNSPSPIQPQQGPMYRRCPECAQHMNRQNYGRVSGVIVDICRQHGYWFDAHELDTILYWLRQGGAQASAIAQRQATAIKQKRADPLPTFAHGQPSGGETLFPTDLGELFIYVANLIV